MAVLVLRADAWNFVGASYTSLVTSSEMPVHKSAPEACVVPNFRFV
jgi:hypothetical protein